MAGLEMSDGTRYARDAVVEDALRKHPDVQKLRKQLEDHFTGAMQTAHDTLPGMQRRSAPNVVVNPQEGMVDDGMPRMAPDMHRAVKPRKGVPARKGRR